MKSLTSKKVIFSGWDSSRGDKIFTTRTNVKEKSEIWVCVNHQKESQTNTFATQTQETFEIFISESFREVTKKVFDHGKKPTTLHIVAQYKNRQAFYRFNNFLCTDTTYS